MRFSFLFELAL